MGVDRLAPYSAYVLAQARGGTRSLEAVELGDAPAWRTSFVLRRNVCRRLGRGAATLWLSRETLLPLRLVERRGPRTRTTCYAYADVNGALPASDFGPPPLGETPFRVDEGFRRTSLAEAAARLPYRPRVPGALPPGFSPAIAGWARRSGVTGPEGSNPRHRGLFGAVYRRGPERIDVTQRLVGVEAWPTDPFAGECVWQAREGAVVQGRGATYAAGPETTPHLFWRRGRLLYTVSGPFPKRDLVAIADSLAPVP